ncbi:MAG: T9SS type A sorting domain-containing protein, partial [Bacteroidota bacterium]
ECQVEFPNNPLVISAPEIPSITEISSTSPSSCGGGDGAIQVEASGENLSYSLDGSSYQRISDFVSLAARAYTVYVRNTDAPSCITSIPVNVAFSVECDERECTGPVNLALNKPSVQSSTLGEGIASLANDGNTTGTDNWGTDANMQHTQDGLGGWWKVDLQEKVSLDGIAIYNRTTEQSSLLNRLRDFYVLSSSSDINTDRELEVLIRDPKVSSTYFSGAAGPVESIALGKTPGRFVMIALAGSGPLHMAEVEVYTCPAPAIIPEDSIDITVGMDPDLSVKEDKVSWTLFPNPFIGESIIEILGDLKRVEYIQVVNVLGSEVEVISPPTSKRLTLGRKLPPGIYTVNLGYGKALLHKKVVKVQ